MVVTLIVKFLKCFANLTEELRRLTEGQWVAFRVRLQVEAR
jgi:hypothetical protein